MIKGYKFLINEEEKNQILSYYNLNNKNTILEQNDYWSKSYNARNKNAEYFIYPDTAVTSGNYYFRISDGKIVAKTEPGIPKNIDNGPWVSDYHQFNIDMIKKYGEANLKNQITQFEKNQNSSQKNANPLGNLSSNQSTQSSGTKQEIVNPNKAQIYQMLKGMGFKTANAFMDAYLKKINPEYTPTNLQPTVKTLQGKILQTKFAQLLEPKKDDGIWGNLTNKALNELIKDYNSK